MSSILEKLKDKPKPQEKQKISITSLLQDKPEPLGEELQEKVVVTTKIIDKTKTSSFNRSEFLKKLKDKQLVKPKILKPIEPIQEERREIIKKPKIRIIRPKKKDTKIKIPKQKKQIEEYKRPEDRPVTSYKIKDATIDTRVKRVKDFPLRVRASNYYLNNREIFINFINTKLLDYRDAVKKEEEDDTVSCDKKVGEFSLLTHQKIIKDYINVYTPYRGLLIYHGLGAGKTCSSIAIAEGIKHSQKIIVMTPASLKQNYMEELKKCGDDLYKKNQFWEFVNSENNEEYVTILSEVLSLPKAFIRKNNGAWLVNKNKKSNYEELSTSNKISLESQLNEMIKSKYQFISYNGLRESHLNTLTAGGTKNPFSNRVVIIDEAHNFVSRIVNKLKKKKSLSYSLYDYIMKAENCRVVFLTGTPIINYPNEIAVMFNMLRGYIKSFTLPLTVQSRKKINKKELEKILKDVSTLDYLDYKPTTKNLKITRNPLGFDDIYDGNKYKGVKRSQHGKVREETFLKQIIETLEKNGIKTSKDKIKVHNYKALPDDSDNFNELFINEIDGSLKNSDLFKRRIIGLTSYFRSAQEQLMPKFDKETDLHVLKIPMSDYQLGVYESARVVERDMEKKSSKKKKKKEGSDEIFKEVSSLYRIYSRSFCNFVFPRTIERPYPNEQNIMSTNIDKDTLDNTSVDERIENNNTVYTEEDREKLEKEMNSKVDKTYDLRIQNALRFLKDNQEEFLSPQGLSIYSPKYLKMLSTILSEKNKGLNLVYSQLRTLEGIGIFALVLEANGFTRFKIKKNSEGVWKIDIKPEDRGKPTYALYTGTETPEEKEIIRNIFNSDWKFVPQELVDELTKVSSNNHYGEIIKIIMITSSGAEGISLKNVRFVHIMEPYWHPVRVEQVIGRARRICSHDALEEDEKNVEVFIYLMEFSDSQKDKKSEITLTKELRLHDVSKINAQPLTSDEYLYEISNRKEEINKQILKTIKETSIDCNVYQKNNKKEGLKCFTFSSKSAEEFAFVPNINAEQKDKTAKMNKKLEIWKAVEANIDGKKYAFRKETQQLYDYESYILSLENPENNPILVGTLEKDDNGNMVIKFV